MRNLVKYSYDWMMYLSWAVIILGIMIIFVELTIAEESDSYNYDSNYEEVEAVKEQTEVLRDIRDVEERESRLRYLEQSRPRPSEYPIVNLYQDLLYNSRFREIMKERYDKR